MSTREQKTITHVYAALTVSLLLSFIPTAGAALCAMLLFTGAWVAAYVVRSRTAHDSLAANHMTFIVRTIWIASGLAFLTMSAALAYILSIYDPSPMLACAGNIPMDPAAIEAAVKPCIGPFITANMDYFVRGGIVGIAPPALYFTYRLSKGLSRALKLHRIGNARSWF